MNINLSTNLNESNVVFSGDIVVGVVRENSENWLPLFGGFQIDQVHLSGNYCQFAYNLTKELCYINRKHDKDLRRGKAGSNKLIEKKN